MAASLSGRGDISVLHAAGRIVGGDGTAVYGAHLRVGDTTAGLIEGESGLVDPRGAEVILVLKTHGPNIPGLTGEMLHTFRSRVPRPDRPAWRPPGDDRPSRWQRLRRDPVQRPSPHSVNPRLPPVPLMVSPGS